MAPLLRTQIASDCQRSFDTEFSETTYILSLALFAFALRIRIHVRIRVRIRFVSVSHYSCLHIVLHNEMHDATTDVTDSHIPACHVQRSVGFRLRARPYSVKFD